MTTTTTSDDAPLKLPPTREAVRDELYVLRRNEGVTPRKVDEAGDNLKRLSISQDEFRRIGAGKGDLPLATVKALKCVVDSYKWQRLNPNEMQNVSWIVLSCELNLDQSSGYDLTGRRAKAHEAMRSLGPKDYKMRSEAVYVLFVDHIVELEESLCRPRDEWLDRAAKKIATRSDDELVATIRSLLLQLGPDAYTNIENTLSVLMSVMPNLADSLKVNDVPGNVAGSVIFDSLNRLGATYYDDLAQRYLSTVDSEALLLPWQTMSPFILMSGWPSADDYAAASKDADNAIDKGDWPLPIPDWSRATMKEEGHLFFGPKDEQATDAFYESLYSSMSLFAQLLARLDRLGRWIIPPPVSKDGKQRTVMFWREIAGNTKFNISDVPIDPITPPYPEKD